MHNLDQTAGQTSFASFREPAWHRLGTVFTETVTSARKMLDLASLSGWNVRQRPLTSDARYETETYEVIRTNPHDGGIDRLGVSGERYTIVQNEEAFDFLQSLSDGSRWETAGALKGGAVVFGTIALETETVLDPSGVADRVNRYLLLAKGHDGSTGITAASTAVRVVCQNTLNFALPSAKQKIKVRHTANVAQRMAFEATMWREANSYFDAFDTEARALFEKSVSDRQYFQIVQSLFPKPEEDKRGSLAKWSKRQEIFAQAWKMEPNAGIRNTAWGAVNALTEANQWGRAVRAGNVENFAAAGAGFDGPTNEFRQKALSLVKSL